jgi:hypothetical protein
MPINAMVFARFYLSMSTAVLKYVPFGRACGDLNRCCKSSRGASRGNPQGQTSGGCARLQPSELVILYRPGLKTVLQVLPWNIDDLLGMLHKVARWSTRSVV